MPAWFLAILIISLCWRGFAQEGQLSSEMLCTFGVIDVAPNKNATQFQKGLAWLSERLSNTTELTGPTVKKSVSLFWVQVSAKPTKHPCPSHVEFAGKQIPRLRHLKEDRACIYRGLLFGQTYTSHPSYQDLAQQTFGAYSRLDAWERGVEDAFHFAIAQLEDGAWDAVRFPDVENKDLVGKIISPIYCTEEDLAKLRPKLESKKSGSD